MGNHWERHSRAVRGSRNETANSLVGDGPDVTQSDSRLGTSERCVDFVQCGTGVERCCLLGVVDLKSENARMYRQPECEQNHQYTHLDRARHALHAHQPPVRACQIRRRVAHADRVHSRALSPRELQDMPTLQDRCWREDTLWPALKRLGPVGECRQARLGGDRDRLDGCPQLLDRDLRQVRHAAWRCTRSEELTSVLVQSRDRSRIVVDNVVATSVYRPIVRTFSVHTCECVVCSGDAGNRQPDRVCGLKAGAAWLKLSRLRRTIGYVKRTKQSSESDLCLCCVYDARGKSREQAKWDGVSTMRAA